MTLASATIDDGCAKNIREGDDVAPALGRAADLDQGELAGDQGRSLMSMAETTSTSLKS